MQAGAPLEKRSRRLVRIAGQSERSQLKHGEVLVETMEMRLSEKILPQWKDHRNLHQKLQKIRKPRVLRPERCYQREDQAPRPADLRQNAGKETKRREGVSLKPVPRLSHSVRARRHLIRFHRL